jgi:TPR repeat protein
MIALGNLYFAGEDLDQDNAKALSLYKAAAAGGDALGAYNAGLVYETSAEDMTQALSWYWRAATGGDEGGMYKLALAYQLGMGLPATRPRPWPGCARRPPPARSTRPTTWAPTTCRATACRSTRSRR